MNAATAPATLRRAPTALVGPLAGDLPLHLAGTTVHARKGAVRNVFRYSVDYVLIEPERPPARAPRLFSLNGANLASVLDRDHGGAPGQGRGAAWLREVLAAHGFVGASDCRVLLLTQPGFLSYVFNPVSFWLACDDTGLRAVVAEVNNTFGDRHSYLCHLPGFAPIGPDAELVAQKLMHVSPFQTVGGEYRFRFAIGPDHVAIRIDFGHGDQGLVATLAGPLRALTDAGLIRALLRRPLGALRTTILIHWQALRLSLKGAKYRRRPEPPTQEVSQCSL